MNERARVRKVGLRDGLQIVPTLLGTARKQEWFDRCVQAGFEEVEIGSFVPNRHLPQIADVELMAAYATRSPRVTGAALVPNLRGAVRAVAATESFSRANLKRSMQGSLAELTEIMRLCDERSKDAENARTEAAISVVFGCPFDASIAGLGGCPNSPGSSGNIATEDLLVMLQSIGIETGIDLARVLELRQFVAANLPDARLFGHVAEVGLPKGFAA